MTDELAARIAIEADNLRAMCPSERVDHYEERLRHGVSVPGWFEMYVLDLGRQLFEGADLDDLDRDWIARRG